jgi:ATP-binding cassette subfamily C (CFTR/MRP) protein 4
MDDSSSSVLALENIDLELKLGELTCIIGSVGGGKSALIQALAGELPPQTGTIERNYSKLAYASQDPWIMDGTVRENILCGAAFDESWYNEVVASCGLAVDFQQFRNKDATIVGDRGVQCSGGQRARIGLARALYRDADVLLLDDPLSAVDSKVSRLIFYSAIQDLGVKRGKCVVLATHQHQFIGEARCILMAKGRIQLLGSYTECVAVSEGKILVAAHTSDDRAQQTVKHKEVGPSNQFEEKVEEVAEDIVTSSDNDHLEKRKTGLLQFETYIIYAKAMGGVFIGCLLFLLFTATQGTLLVCIAALGKWAERSPEDQVRVNFYLP